jgi:FKBP-type peptidyl-prolyl cis-trans isomerase
LQLTGNVDGNSELLALGYSNAQISVSDYDQANSRITLTGTATAAEYQAVLRSLAYFNGQHSQATRGDRQVVMDVVDVLGRTQSATIQINYLTDQSAIDDAILQKFIADNNLNAVSAQEGLFAVIDEPGQGLNPTANDSVRVAYTGRFLTVNDQNQIVEGESFDASSESGISFSLGQVIRGWTLGIRF